MLQFCVGEQIRYLLTIEVVAVFSNAFLHAIAEWSRAPKLPMHLQKFSYAPKSNRFYSIKICPSMESRHCRHRCNFPAFSSPKEQNPSHVQTEALAAGCATVPQAGEG